MENLTIFKNKENQFNCQFQADGFNAEDLKVRLCLEFNDNVNLHFYGSIDKDGVCNITIPKLNIDSKKGNMFVEAIADNIYFKLYESTVEVKNSVELKMKVVETTMKSEGIQHNLKEVKLVNSKLEPKNEIKKETEQKIEEKIEIPQKVIENPKKITEEKKAIKSNKLGSFNEYFKNKNNKS